MRKIYKFSSTAVSFSTLKNNTINFSVHNLPLDVDENEPQNYASDIIEFFRPKVILFVEYLEHFTVKLKIK
jgi:hypothetical protein